MLNFAAPTVAAFTSWKAYRQISGGALGVTKAH
jgi:hypothetical protein